MRFKLTVAAALVVVLVGTVATLAWAKSQADTTIRACVANSNGDVRIPDAGAACKKNEQVTSWNVTGPPGPQGAAGQQGAAGPQGPAGAQGPAGSGGGAAASPNAIQGSFTAIGQKQGAITGDGPSGTMILIGMSHAITSPRDAASGLPTGKRQHKPVTIYKELDKSTPKFLNALFENERLTTVTFSLTRGSSSAPHGTVKLTNASVSSRIQSGNTEELQFTYQKIEWTWIDGGITAEDDWESPVG